MHDNKTPPPQVFTPCLPAPPSPPSPPPPQALLTADEASAAPTQFVSVPLKGGGAALKEFKYRMQVGAGSGGRERAG